MIQFTIYRGLSGDVHTLLTAWCDGEKLCSTLFREDSFFDWSLRLAKRRLKRKIKILGLEKKDLFYEKCYKSCPAYKKNMK